MLPSGEDSVQDVVDERPFNVTTRFEVAAARIAEGWIEAGRVRVSAEELAIARQFLEQTGWTVEEVPGLLLRLRYRGGRPREVTREEAMLIAFRDLAARLRPARERCDLRRVA